ncbi:MbnP family protein [Flavobacterium sp.]|uniref:MbnP family protein n=1 Tax=Flavobacterium sp. TaxID=239 RepID=UPI003BC42498
MKKVVVVIVIFALVCLSFQMKKNQKDVDVLLQLNFQNESLVLNDKKYVTKTNDTVTITKMKFYLSNIVLELEDGTQYKESNSVHLVDAETLSSLEFHLKNVPDIKIKKIRFDIGIDSLTSVSENFDGDLDPALGMYWAWNTGYINMKLEGKSSSCTNVKKEFQFHIGGYLPKQNALQKIEFEIDENQIINIEVELSKWLDSLSLKETNSIMIPGEKAIAMARIYKNIFEIKQ